MKHGNKGVLNICCSVEQLQHLASPIVSLCNIYDVLRFSPTIYTSRNTSYKRQLGRILQASKIPEDPASTRWTVNLQHGDPVGLCKLRNTGLGILLSSRC